MYKTSNTIRRMCVLAGISAMAALATATPVQDAKISIDRALNSPTVTVRYAGASAALVEMRLNGESIGTRTVTSSKANGETNFNINLSDLKDGDNEVEIRLFDRTGKLVGSEKTNIATDQTQYGPVFLSTPKVGQTVMGNVDIKLGFGRELRNVYVSFFVDNNFKKMTNFPPYEYSWDTTGETPGWHEIEAWAVDESNSTFKTRKTRVFVNNPGGRTERIGRKDDLTTSSNPSRSTVTGTDASYRDINLRGSSVAVNEPAGGAPRASVGTLRANPIRNSEVTATMSGLKPAPTGASIPTGTKAIVPPTRIKISNDSLGMTNRTTVATRTRAPQGQTLSNVASASNLIRITKGQRLPNLASFAVVFNSQFVDFDVTPRVDDGVPMTPFRHLLEKAGGKVDWKGATKTVLAKSEGKDIILQIGDRSARINDLSVSLETAPYIDRGRTIVPLSFMSDALNVTIEFDKETGHVLITSKKG